MGIFDKKKKVVEEKKPQPEQATKKKMNPLNASEEKNEQPHTLDPAALEFEMMYGLNDVTSETTKPYIIPEAKGEKEAKEAKEEKDGKPFFYKPVYKRTVNKTLTIFLIENTAEVTKEKEKVSQIINHFFAKSDLMCMINYGDTVEQGEVIDLSTLKNQTVVYREKIGEKACLFDALQALYELVLSKYFMSEEKEKERFFINRIEIIGIGTCTDNGSTTSKEDALEKFLLTTDKTGVSTKYYCIKEEYFLNAAEVGFHSIGSIPRAYQKKKGAN